mgnify:CR=1 FL=1
MPKHSKRFAELDSKVDPLARYGLKEALALVKTTASAKFDETVEVALKLNVNPAKGEENVRGTLVLLSDCGLDDEQSMRWLREMKMSLRRLSSGRTKPTPLRCTSKVPVVIGIFFTRP